ncbi:MAG: tyrosine-type recombinase/integrase [Ruminococcus sp.]
MQQKSAFEAQKSENVTLLPDFSCHTLRHTFATRMCEMGINLKVIQDVLGHSDFSTTMNVYTDATSDFKRKNFRPLKSFSKAAVPNNKKITDEPKHQ